MIPPLIVEYALDFGINLIAITDHNSSANVSAVQKAAENTSLIVLPGMELQTKEEVHSLCLFDTTEQLSVFQNLVNSTLPKLTNQPEHFGEQFIVDENGEFIAREEQLLLCSCSLSITEAWNIVTKSGGLFIPAHVDRKSFGLIENLGLVPSDIELQVLEISKNISPTAARSKFPQIKGYPLFQSGDVHRLDEFIGSLHLNIENPTISEITLAITQCRGRSFSIDESP
jgi:3',5'-nucleoside bisphosphate phosphatase